MAVGKKLVKAREGIDREKLYPIAEAVKLIK
ncbi:MAG: 50S ribosomal protein L1, partial [Rhizobiales bacterium]|nr:50S ribosomal protein L1 [Hyphomicrobiales bacterium]